MDTKQHSWHSLVYGGVKDKPWWSDSRHRKRREERYLDSRAHILMDQCLTQAVLARSLMQFEFPQNVLHMIMKLNYTAVEFKNTTVTCTRTSCTALSWQIRLKRELLTQFVYL